MSITIKRVSKRFGSFVALDQVSVEVPSGCLLALLGPSGSGKTTLLRILGGLETPDEGSVHFHDEDMTAASPRARNAGFVFQHYALFRHMTVFENVAFGLRVRKWTFHKIRSRVLELIHLVGLDGLDRRLPSQLSGGQRQRVALARALAIEPRILLLDEPFGALDAKVRTELRRWLRRLHDEMHVTSIFVTHDQEEAFEVADKVVLMNKGRIEQVGSPMDIFEHPSNPFVMDFLGHVNVFHGRVENGQANFGPLQISYPSHPHAEPAAVSGYVRPHEIHIYRTREIPTAVSAEIIHITPSGSFARVQLSASSLGSTIHVDVTRERFRELNLKVGESVYIAPKQVRVFAPDDYSI